MELNSSIEDDVKFNINRAVIISLLLGIIILTTIIGNLFVISSILLERNLRHVSNYLILSLAVTDLLVACVVMPFSAIYEVNKEWRLGPELCDLWTASDVLCCTASILHLVAIALDRYWAVTNIMYTHQRTELKMYRMILIVWTMAFLVSIAPVIGWKDLEWRPRIENQQICLISQDLGYQIFATSSSFYVPLFVILFLYWKIYEVARKRIRRHRNSVEFQVSDSIPGAPTNLAAGGVITAAGGSGGVAAAVIAIIGRPTTSTSDDNTVTNTTKSLCSPEGTSNTTDNSDMKTLTPKALAQMAAYHYKPQEVIKKRKRRKHRKETVEAKRERRAAKTLAIITGAFIVCWLPFFILAILQPIYNAKKFSPLLQSILMWLGYFNSTLNPILYTIFSPEFRHAFKKNISTYRFRSLIDKH